jgi:hypothetical protein
MGSTAHQALSIPQVIAPCEAETRLVSANHSLGMLARHREAGFRPNQRNVRLKRGFSSFDGVGHVC